jgi:outer membrane translocation and assembly module TamA
MMRTPVGPIRVDWGFLLEPVDGEPDYVVHFSVGHPY